MESSGAIADGVATTAASKILQGLPTRAATPARSVLETATIVTHRRSRPTPSVVLLLANAIEQAKQVRVDYRLAGNSESSHRILEPWGLVVRHRRWYLIGRNPARDATRTYRVDRIEHVDVLAEGFEPPEGTDVASVFEDHLQNSWQFTTCVDIAVSSEVAREWIPFTMGTMTQTSPNSCRLEGNTNNCESYITDLLRTPFAFTVRGGTELLDAVSAIRTRLHGDQSSHITPQRLGS